MHIILHNIRSAHNVGSIFRTADGAGVEKLHLCGYTPGPVKKNGHPRVRLTKVALGAEETVEWESNESTVETIRRLREVGFKIFALEERKSTMNDEQRTRNIFNLNAEEYDFAKTALVVGNEVEGIGEDILKEADEVLEIPMYGEKKSLNVSVAFGIAVYHLQFLQKQKLESTK